MRRDLSDTIAAISTPIGIGGISVIRISGHQAIPIAARLFHGRQDLTEAKPNTIHYGDIAGADDQLIDKALVSVFSNPHSYTGEDVIEISCHGGYFAAQRILEAVIASGVRLAEPGEFTQRAFLNGKMDLTQAEAVAELIHSKSERAYMSSLEQLKGRLSGYITGLRADLLDVSSLLELELDFSQEGIELADKTKVMAVLDRTITGIRDLLLSYRVGKVFRDGVKVVITGRPNAGKSSLLNLLLNENRAIVSEVPGTTRDVIEENITIGGILFRLVDTAGVREALDAVEKEGVRRTKAQIETADILLIIIDSSDEAYAKGASYFTDIYSPFDERAIFLFNKTDLVQDNNGIKMPDAVTMRISCTTRQGIDLLKSKLVELALPNYDSTTSSVLVQSTRHVEALRKALDSLELAKASLNLGMSGDFVAVDLHAALEYLGEIIGLTTPDDILNNIFAKFCIGK